MSKQGFCQHDYIDLFPSCLSSDPPYLDEGSLLIFQVLQNNIQVLFITFFRKNLKSAYKYIVDSNGVEWLRV